MKPIDPLRFRQVLGHFPTGVAVVTAIGGDGEPAGMAVGSFTSVSLDPPLVAFLPDRSSTSWPRIEESGSFCVNILGAHQEDVCRTFAVKGGDKFAGLPWRPAASGSPLLDGVVAWIDCDIETVHEAGDHYIVIGRVRELDVANPNLPLLFFQGGYGRFTPASLAAWEGDLVIQLRSADLARPAMESIAQDLGVECVASAVVGEEMVLVASAGRLHGLLASTQMGQRIPFMAPLGTAFVAWAAGAAREAWIKRLGDHATPENIEAIEATLAAVRRAGYSLGRGSAWHTEVGEVLAHEVPERRSRESTEMMRQLIAVLPADYETPEIRPDDEVRTLSAPVFGPDGGVVLVLSLLSVGTPIADVPAYAARLREATESVAAALR